jgi:hypothetical protein
MQMSVSITVPAVVVAASNKDAKPQTTRDGVISKDDNWCCMITEMGLNGRKGDGGSGDGVSKGI